jgi:hypothetical protein
MALMNRWRFKFYIDAGGHRGLSSSGRLAFRLRHNRPFFKSGQSTRPLLLLINSIFEFSEVIEAQSTTRSSAEKYGGHQAK